jgi:hypothetical protein
MPRRTSSRRRHDPKEAAKYVLAAALLLIAVSAGGAFLYKWMTVEPPPKLDQTTYCPIDGPRATLVFLIDTSDPLPPPAAKEVRTMLFDTADALRPYGLLEIRTLDAAGDGLVIFSRCNPGDGSDLNAFTGNPALAHKRWQESFQRPLAEVLEHGLEPAPSKTSPIMATIQNIAIERFTGRANELKPKSLVVVSDMLEYTPDYSLYRGSLAFDRYRNSPAFSKFRTDLHGAAVTLLMVQRKAPHISTVDLMQFWHDWIRDNNGQWKEGIKLQGVE